MSQAPDWEQWEGEIVAGEFPLQNLIGTGAKSAVFRTTGGSIKLVPASPSQAQELVAQWNRAQALKHSHFLRIHKSGTWSRDGAAFAFLVMENAEENLAEVLSGRPLTAEETRELLPPVAAALAVLHQQGLAHGRLKPSNVFAIDDTLKLSSDSVATGSPSDDMRAVAALIETALGKTEQPQDIREIVKNCAPQNGAPQWSAEELSRWLASPRGTGLVKPVQVAVAKPRAPRVTRVAFGVGAGLVLLLAVGGILKSRSSDPGNAPAAKSVAPSAEVSTALPAPVKEKPAKAVKTRAPIAENTESKAEAPREEPPPPPPVRAPVQSTSAAAVQPARAPGQIAIQVLPEITDKARSTVHGTVVLRVRVKVDPSGEVTDATLLPTGSHYLGKLSLEAARKWKFAPAGSGGAREGTVRFEITHTETKASADIR